MGLTEARITGRFLSEVTGRSSISSTELSVCVSTSRESQLRVNFETLSALSAAQVNILTLLVCPLA